MAQPLILPQLNPPHHSPLFNTPLDSTEDKNKCYFQRDRVGSQEEVSRNDFEQQTESCAELVEGSGKIVKRKSTRQRAHTHRSLSSLQMA
jgi:hypothetical protein